VKGYLTTIEAAEKLGVSIRRVVALINSGNLPSTRIGRSHVIKESDLKLVKDRKPGRPSKEQSKK
jgi:excisionase family DNA binding protein